MDQLTLACQQDGKIAKSSLVAGTYKEPDSADSDGDSSDVAVDRGGALSRQNRRRFVEYDPDPSTNEEAEHTVVNSIPVKTESAQLADQNNTSGYGTLSPREHIDQSASDQLLERSEVNLSHSFPSLHAELHPEIPEESEHHSTDSTPLDGDGDSFCILGEATFSPSISISNVARPSVTPSDSSNTQLTPDQDVGVLVASGGTNEQCQETVPGWTQPQEMVTLSHPALACIEAMVSTDQLQTPLQEMVTLSHPVLVWGSPYVHPCLDTISLHDHLDGPTLMERPTLRPFVCNAE